MSQAPRAFFGPQLRSPRHGDWEDVLQELEAALGELDPEFARHRARRQTAARLWSMRMSFAHLRKEQVPTNKPLRRAPLACPPTKPRALEESNRQYTKRIWPTKSRVLATSHDPRPSPALQPNPALPKSPTISTKRIWPTKSRELATSATASSPPPAARHFTRAQTRPSMPGQSAQTAGPPPPPIAGRQQLALGA